MYTNRAPSYRRAALGELGERGGGATVNPYALTVSQSERGGTITRATQYGQTRSAQQFAAAYPGVPAHWGTFTKTAGLYGPIIFTPSDQFKNSPISRPGDPGMPTENPIGHFGWSPTGREILAYLQPLQRGTQVYIQSADPRQPSGYQSFGGEKEAKAKAALAWAISTGHVSHRGVGGGSFKSQILPILAVAAPAIIGLAAPAAFGAAAGAGTVSASQAAEAAAMAAGGITGGAAGAGSALTAVGTTAASAVTGASLLSQIGSALKDAAKDFATDQVKGQVIGKAQEFVAEKFGPPLPEGFTEPGTIGPAPAGAPAPKISGTAILGVIMLAAAFLNK